MKVNGFVVENCLKGLEGLTFGCKLVHVCSQIVINQLKSKADAFFDLCRRKQIR